MLLKLWQRNINWAYPILIDAHAGCDHSFVDIEYNLMMEESMEYVNLTNANVPADETRSQDQAQGQGGSVLYMPGPGEAGSQ